MLKILKHLSVYKWMVGLILILIFAQSMTELYLPTLMGDIVDNGIVVGDIPYIWKIGALMLLVAAIGVAVSITSSYFSSQVATAFGRDTPRKVVRHVGLFSRQESAVVGTASI